MMSGRKSGIGVIPEPCHIGEEDSKSQSSERTSTALAQSHPAKAAAEDECLDARHRGVEELRGGGERDQIRLASVHAREGIRAVEGGMYFGETGVGQAEV